MVYTIGYAGITLDKFLEVMRELNVSTLIDVRSLPKSKYFYKFNDNNLKEMLAKINVDYENWKNEFGARQENLDFYQNDVLDYEIFAQSKQFENGIEKIKKIVKENKTICLMCSEIDPINCHRAVLCGRNIARQSIEVKHIIAKRDGSIKIENNKEFEHRLMAETKIDNLEEAYRKQNKKIGYKLT